MTIEPTQNPVVAGGLTGTPTGTPSQGKVKKKDPKTGKNIPQPLTLKSKVKVKGVGVPPKPKATSKVDAKGGGSGSLSGTGKSTANNGKGLPDGKDKTDPKAEKQDPKGVGKKMLMVEVLYERSENTFITAPAIATKAPLASMSRGMASRD